MRPEQPATRQLQVTPVDSLTRIESMPAAELRAGLAALKLELDAAAREKLLAYVALLDRWNRHFNLTAIRDPAEMVTRHLLDSLAVLPHLQGQRFIDVGSGAGLPGIPLAIAAPDSHFTLLDSNGKKTRFLVQASSELQLENIRVVKQRVADFRPDQLYDGVLSRAFASLGDMMSGCRHLLASSGEFYAMKGQHPQSELQDLAVTGLSISSLAVPGLEGDRCLLRFRPA